MDDAGSTTTTPRQGTRNGTTSDGTHARAAGDGRVAAQLVDAQRELEHLRRAMRHRGLIDQAKGVLMGWLGVPADEAFGVLVGYSQRTNRKLTHAAAALLEFAEQRGRQLADGVELPSDLQLFAELAQTRIDRRLDGAAIAAAPVLQGVLLEVRTSLPDLQPRAALIGAIEPDGAVRILAADGFDPDVIAGWERIPPNADVPLSFTAATGTPVLCDDKADREERFPGSKAIPSDGGAVASLPIELGGVRLGVLGLAWADGRRFASEDLDRLLDVAHAAALPLAQDLEDRGALATGLPDLLVEPGRARWFHTTIDHLPVGVVLLEPVVDGGRLVDCTVLHASPRATAHLEDPVRPLGRRVSELSPWLEDSPLWDALDEVWRHGDPAVLPQVELVASEPQRPATLTDVSVTRLGGLLVLGVGRIELLADG